jgi:hypothetical protein
MKVLSIDLDYIMSPTIELYQELYFNDNPLTRWDLLYNGSDFRESHLYIDQANLLFCYETFLKALKNCSNVKFGYEHDSILYELCDKKDLDIINIDHHDDYVSLEFDQFQNPLEMEHKFVSEYDRVHEGNWVSWIHSNEKLKKYTWIYNETSKNLNRNRYNIDSMGEKYEYYLKEEYNFEDYNFDYIFVCLSPQYVPKNHWHYFTMFIMAYEQYTGQKVDMKSFANKKFEFELRYKQITDEILYKRPDGR